MEMKFAETIAIYKENKEAGFTESQIDAIFNSLDVKNDLFATKSELQTSFNDLKNEIALMNSDFKTEISLIHSEFKSEISLIHKDISQLRWWISGTALLTAWPVLQDFFK